MDLFEYGRNKTIKNRSPLASRIRPDSFESFYGQEHIIYKNSPLVKLINTDRLGSIIIYGPPGTGKTTLAMIISIKTNKVYENLSAVNAGIKDIKTIIKNAEDNLSFYSKGTILFIDEIHRFNKIQQDALLPNVENGLITLIGATTENPYFEVNSALLSRCKVIQFKSLSSTDIVKALKRGLNIENGLKNYNISIKDESLELIANLSSGDIRTALNTLEIIVLTLADDKSSIAIDEKMIRDIFFESTNIYDKKGDYHYNTISAFIKSMRGSDPDAAILYLAKMIESGEDPKFIARRMIIFASEDIGNADPNALNIANNVFRAVEIVGLPEAELCLAQGVIYLSTAIKSNRSYLSLKEARKDLNKISNLDIPNYLLDSHCNGTRELSHGEGYKYPHDYQNSYVKQRYFPYNIKVRKYYFPSDSGYEKKIKKYIENLKGE